MRLELTGRHLVVTPALRRLVERKLSRLERMLNDAALSAQVVLAVEKHQRRADVTLHARGEKFLHAVGVAGVWEAAMGDAMEKLLQQAQKVKGKWQERKRGRGRDRGNAEPPPADSTIAVVKPVAASRRVRMPQIFKSARQAIVPMSVAEAARQAAANGDGVVIFRDLDTRSISVLCRRGDGELTLIETS
jgi:putative sigma-54 modulation protein